MNADLYSLRMRATGAGRHVSGAERIVAPADVAATSSAMIGRAMQASHPPPDDVRCTIERLDAAAVTFRPLPDISSWDVSDSGQGRRLASRLLVEAGVSPGVAAAAIEALAHGAAPGGQVMRGAMIVDADSGERLEEDPGRGVRVSRMDLAPDSRKQIEQRLAAAGLGHARIAEALVLAGKVLEAPGLVAELCWSDAPDYVAGYVADPRGGYQRITRLKENGARLGGRAFFVDRATWRRAEFIEWLERRPVLFTSLGTIRPLRSWSAG